MAHAIFSSNGASNSFLDYLQLVSHSEGNTERMVKLYQCKRFIDLRSGNVRPEVANVNEAMLLSSVNELLADGILVGRVDIDNWDP